MGSLDTVQSGHTVSEKLPTQLLSVLQLSIFAEKYFIENIFKNTNTDMMSPEKFFINKRTHGHQVLFSLIPAGKKAKL